MSIDGPPGGNNGNGEKGSENNKNPHEVFRAADADEIVDEMKARGWGFPIFIRRTHGQWRQAESREGVAEILDDLKAFDVEVSQTEEE